MTLQSTRLLRILGFAALLFIAIGQGLHASEILFAPDEAGECHHNHSDAAPNDCPVEHACCHLHGPGMTLAIETVSLPEIRCRDILFSQSDILVPDGCLREIDYPPQLS